MRTFLFFILVAVAFVLLWAIWSQSYVNTTIFTLGLLATGLCGYLISDYFFNIEKKTGQSDLNLYKKEVAALKEELDILRKQSVLATPQAEVDDIKSRFYLLEEEKNKINGDFLAQAATISQLNTRLEFLQKEYNKLKEESTVTTESRATELEAIRDTLGTTKTKISDLAIENESLKMELADYKEMVTTQKTQLKEVESLKLEIAQYQKAVTAKTETLEIVTPENESFVNTPNMPKTVFGKIEVETKVIPINENTERFDLQPYRKRSHITENNGRVKEVLASPVSDIQINDNQDINSENQTQIVSDKVESESLPAQMPHPIYGTSDDLKVIEGIGPKIESLLKAAGIENWHDLAEASVTNLRGVLEQAGSRYRLNDPSTWPEQARLLSRSEWEKFKIYTDYLIGGRKPKA